MANRGPRVPRGGGGGAGAGAGAAGGITINTSLNVNQEEGDGIDDPLRTLSSSAATGATTTTANATTAITASTFVVRKDGDTETFVKKTRDRSDIDKLRKLKELFDLGILTEVEYTDRKSQLVDEITGTRSGKNKSKYRGQSLSLSLSVSVFSPPLVTVGFFFSSSTTLQPPR